MNLRLSDVIASPDALMGVKAVWARSREPVMCFGSRGNPQLKDRAHFSRARTTAERAQSQPYFVTIGGGEQVPDALRGRVLEVVRATGVYGETSAFVRDEDLRARLAQWPVAIIVSEIYAVAGEPLLVEDLGFPDRRILMNAYDIVVRDEKHIQQLWEALKDRQLERRRDVVPPPGLCDPHKVQLCGAMYPRLDSKSAEGKRVLKLSLEIGRDPKLELQAKKLNRLRNSGTVVCEACGFSDPLDPMFDAHHVQPLAAGDRESRADDLAVLCPTCHRWAHAKAGETLSPVPLVDLRRVRASRT